MNYMGAFTPCETTYTIAVSTTSGGGPIPGTGNIARVCNVGSTECFIRFSEDNTEATTESFPIPGNTIQYVVLSDGYDTVDAITASGTTTLRVTRGTMG